MWVLRIGIWISLGTIIMPATPWLPTHSFTVPHPVCDYMISSIFFLLYSLFPLLFYAFMLLCGLIPFLSCSLFLFHIFLCNPHYLAFGSCFELLFIILFFSLELNLFNHFPLSSLELCFFFLTQRWPMSFSVFSQLPLLTPTLIQNCYLSRQTLFNFCGSFSLTVQLIVWWAE